MPKIFSLAETLAIAKAANKHANDHIEKSGTNPFNNLLVGKGRFNALRESVADTRTVVFQRDILEDSDLSLFEEVIDISGKYSLGNCFELALWSLDYILNFVPYINAEVCEIKGGDHIFLVLNRKISDEDSAEPENWGENAVICDPWAKKFYPATEYLTELKNFKYDKANKQNLTEMFNKNKHKIDFYTQLNTDFLRKKRKITTLKKNFIERLNFICETLTFYHDLLANEIKELEKDHEDKKAEILLKKLQSLQKQIDAIKKDIEEVQKSEYKGDYRTIRSEMINQFSNLKIKSISTMQFTDEEKAILFSKDATPEEEQYNILKTQSILMLPEPPIELTGFLKDEDPHERLNAFGLFNAEKKRSKTERHIQEITDAVNNRLKTLRLKKPL